MMKLSLSRSSLMLMAAVVFLLCVVTSVAAPAQTFTTLFSFHGNGTNLGFGSLIQGTNGNFYGTTSGGGAHNEGTVFEITPAGKLTTLYDFCSQTNSEGYCTDGSLPYVGLIQATNGNFYGTTLGGGAYNAGTVFEIIPAVKLTTLYSFCSERNSQDNCTDGESPGTLVQATDGHLYGTTGGGGDKDYGTVFEITLAGKLTTLHSFCSQSDCADGGIPSGGFVQTHGDFYGTTSIGGIDGGGGTMFKITPAGAFTTLFTFDGADGSAPDPFAGLMQATNGNFYGTTVGGDPRGTAFEITPAGVLTTLYRFDETDGGAPYDGLMQATDGNFYGTTTGGGATSEGTAYVMTPGGTLTVLYSFCSQDYPVCTDGIDPRGGLMQATNGNLYGTTLAGGTGKDGTIFSLSVGLSPFVKTNPTSGTVGTKVTILGNNLKTATSVTFNGIAVGSFTVNSSGSAIMTTVPTGATTGEVEVTTNTGTLKSNVVFRIP
jgi:uncharacterized repeat protein (TIGR03803 family)